MHYNATIAVIGMFVILLTRSFRYKPLQGVKLQKRCCIACHKEDVPYILV
jgi:hypothetical protein